jgi:hypothetical protein
MRTMNRERGMTAIGWLIVLLLIAFFALLGMKIGPIYLENYTIKTVVASLKQEPLITQKSASQVKSMVMRRLDINGVYDIKSDHVSVKKTPGVLTVEIRYKVQKPLIGNLDVVATFAEKVELVSN